MSSIGAIKCFGIIKGEKKGYLGKGVKKIEKAHIFLTNWGEKQKNRINFFKG